MKNARRAFGLLAVALSATLAVPQASGGDETAGKPALRLRAYAIDLNHTGATTSTRSIDIVIERWSTDAERDRLRGILIEKGGGDSLLKAVQAIKPRAGYVRTATSLGWDIQFARQLELPNGGRRVVIGSDRPMSFWELSNQTRSSDYEFMLADIRLGPDGKGEGKLVPAAMVTYDEGTKTIEVENWDIQPVRLTQVTTVK
jgi:hypothetical protein